LGRLWETHINNILACPELGFRHTTHDHTIYETTFCGHKLLLLRQVDDFSLSCPSEDIAKDVFDIIGRKLQLPSEDQPPFKYLGLIDDFNGIDVIQTQDYISLSSESYIRRVLKTHGWDRPSPSEPSSTKPVSPLPADAVSLLFATSGPAEHTTEHAALESKHKFGYRTLLGELLFAYVTCRPDIGYAITTLSKFATCPADIHYTSLKGLAKYLRKTISWSINFRKTISHPSLPPSHIVRESLPDNFPAFPSIHSHHLCGFVDAAYANDLRNRRSTTGYAFLYSGAVIAYRSFTQSLTAVSSTEAEFYAAVSAAKIAIYLRSVLTDLGFPPDAPTSIYEDNQAAIMMINARLPTPRARHVDIQWFAIQDWKDSGSIIMHFIPSILNPSDDLTKPLGWVLHSRHARRLMGYSI
jgi:hypothetical protein